MDSGAERVRGLGDVEFYLGGSVRSSPETASKQGAVTRLQSQTNGTADSHGNHVPAAYTKRCLMEC